MDNILVWRDYEGRLGEPRFSDDYCYVGDVIGNLVSRRLFEELLANNGCVNPSTVFIDVGSSTACVSHAWLLHGVHCSISKLLIALVQATCASDLPLSNQSNLITDALSPAVSDLTFQKRTDASRCRQ